MTVILSDILSSLPLVGSTATKLTVPSASTLNVMSIGDPAGSLSGPRPSIRPALSTRRFAESAGSGTAPGWSQTSISIDCWFRPWCRGEFLGLKG